MTSPLLIQPRRPPSVNRDEEAGRTAMPQQMALLVTGKTGNGKSAVCNTIAGVQESVLDQDIFPTGRSMSSATTQMQYHDTHTKDCILRVVDTPDVTNLDWEEYQMQQEVQKWKTTIRDFPYTVLLAVRYDVRYTAEEYQVYREFLRLWGDDSVKSRLVVAFTFCARKDEDIREELKTVCPELKSVLRDAGDRYVVFNNKADASVKKETVENLFKMAPIIQVEEIPLPHAYSWKCVHKALIVFNVIILVIVIGVIFDYLNSLNWGSIGLFIFVILACLVFIAILVKRIVVHVR